MSADRFSRKHRGWSSQGRDGLPATLREAESPRRSFDDARDPTLKQQRLDLEKTEAQRREAMGSGSLMVKLSKPFPELRPRNDNAKRKLRESFNQRWEAEKSRAKREPFSSKQSGNTNKSKDPFERPERISPSRGLGR